MTCLPLGCETEEMIEAGHAGHLGRRARCSSCATASRWAAAEIAVLGLHPVQHGDQLARRRRVLVALVDVLDDRRAERLAAGRLDLFPIVGRRGHRMPRGILAW